MTNKKSPVHISVNGAFLRNLSVQVNAPNLLTSVNMKQRLLKAKNRPDGIPCEVVREKLGI